MSGFKDMVADDVHAVFLNLDEFAQKRTIRYDGEEYQDIPIVFVRDFSSPWEMAYSSETIFMPTVRPCRADRFKALPTAR